MEAYFLLLTVFGAVVILTAWLPRLLERLPLSLPMVCIGDRVRPGVDPVLAGNVG